MIGNTKGALQVRLNDTNQFRRFANNVYYNPPASGYVVRSLDGMETQREFLDTPATSADYWWKMAVDHGLEGGSVETSLYPVFQGDHKPVGGRAASNTAVPMNFVDDVPGGSIVNVNDAQFFRVGDEIRFRNPTTKATTSIKEVIGIDMAVNEIELSTTTGISDGDEAWLESLFDNGSNTPDIGAVQIN